MSDAPERSTAAQSGGSRLCDTILAFCDRVTRAALGQTAGRTGGQAWRRGTRLAVSSLVATLLASSPLRAQGSPAEDSQQTQDTRPGPAGPAPASGLDAKQTELKGLQEGIEASAAKRRALSEEMAQLETDRAKLEAALIDTTRKVYDAEGRINETEKRLDGLTAKEDATKASLRTRRAAIAEVLAALQRMGRKPPPALLVEPEDILRAVRTSMLLGAVLPGMRAETEALVADLTTLTQTRKEIEAERQSLDAEMRGLSTERARLAALVDARQSAIGKDEAAIIAERDRAAKLAEQAGSLKDLIRRMEHESNPAQRAADAAKESDEKLAAMMPGAAPTAPFKDPARLAPAIAFASTRGLLPHPVNGTLLRRYGEDDGLGGTEKGELQATRPSAIVAAPADGWIAYAGPYRSFGKLLILNAGGGYYIVLAGMDRINVNLGQFVLAGEPVAVMGDGTTKTAAAVAIGASQPVLYVEFRKDGTTIDPGPWWARPELQKVRG